MGPHGYPETFFPDARKFDSGGTISPILISMLLASLQEVCALDMDLIQPTLKILMQPLLDWAIENDMWVPRSHHFHLVGLKPRNITVEDMPHSMSAA
jgi:hypothetical protein